MEANARTADGMLQVELDVSIGTISNRLGESVESKKLDKWVSHELSFSSQQKQPVHRLNCDVLQRMYPLQQSATCSAQWLDHDQAPRQKFAINYSPFYLNFKLFQTLNFTP